ncbi:MAG TPA: J domain-containing protein [Dongiaceae bacterium]|jgi:hypothetical protein|nr:J domain-containing protein [Dongiaceae bacterium]
MARKARKTEEKTEARACDRPGCAGEGRYRAPRDRTHLRDYYYFCLDHVRDYNKTWDYYAGMGPEEIEREIRNSIVGERPSWPLGRRGAPGLFARRMRGSHFIPDDASEDIAQNFGERRGGKAKVVQTREDAARELLGLAPNATFTELRQRYKALVKRWHPDAHGGNRDAEEKLKDINQAYSLLKAALRGDAT